MASASSVANAFLDLQERDGSVFPPIDQMKLQKLVFYAHAWSLALRGRPLFDDDVEAWPWGPVIRDVYVSFKNFGKSPIRGHRAQELRRVGDRFTYGAPPEPDADEMQLIESVWKTHRMLTGVQLSNATHASGEPWTIVSNECGGDLSDKPRIPNELIADVFRTKVTDRPNRPAA